MTMLVFPSPVPDIVSDEAVSTIVVSDPDELAKYSDAWDELLLLQPFPLPMSSSAWLRSHAECMLAPEQKLCVIFARRGERLIGALPVIVSTNGNSRDLSAPCGLHTRSVDLTLAPDCAHQAVGMLLTALQRVCPRWQSYRLASIPDQTLTGPAIEKLESAVNWCEPSGRGAFVNTAGDYHVYLESLSYNFARNLRRIRSKLKSDYLTEFQVVKAVPGDGRYLEEFLTLEASGWKGSQGTAIKSSPYLREFYRALTERLAQRGWLEYHRLTGNGRIMASHVAVRFDRKLVLLKIAYDEQFSSYAPGNMLMYEIIRRSFLDPEIDEVNCLTDMVWQANWKMSYHGYNDIILFPRRPLAVLTGYLPQVMRERLRHIGPIHNVYRWIKQHLMR